MAKTLWLAAAMASVLLVAATSRSDELTEQPPPIIDLSEPATVPLGPNPPRDPFTPHDPGPQSDRWTYEDMSPSEQAAADRGRDASSWRAVHDVYNAALAERDAIVSAHMAQRRLGVQDLEAVGVVP